MRLRRGVVALALLLAGCGGTRPRVQTAETAQTENEGAPPLVWDQGERRVTVQSIGVVFRVGAPIARFAPDEIATERCGDRMLHAMIVDRRISPVSDEILGRPFLRADCHVPQEGRIVGYRGNAREWTIVVHYDGGEMDGDWELHSLVLDRAHRSLALVSAQRVLPHQETTRLFTIEQDMPGLETMANFGPEEPVPSQAMRTLETVLGAARVVGEVLRIFR